MPSPARISDAEWSVMQVIWDQGSATAAQVIEALQPKTGWNHQTLRTMLSRLIKKGMLRAEPEKNRFIYYPVVSRDRCIREEGRSFLRKVFRGNTDELLVHFVREGNLTSDGIAQLQKMIDDAERQENGGADTD